MELALIFQFLALTFAFRGESFKSHGFYTRKSLHCVPSETAEISGHQTLVDELIAASDNAHPLEFKTLVKISYVLFY